MTIVFDIRSLDTHFPQTDFPFEASCKSVVLSDFSSDVNFERATILYAE